MGNTRPGGSLPGDTGGGGSSAAREGAGPSSGPRARASGSPAISKSSARSNGNESAVGTTTPLSPARGGPEVSSSGMSGRNAPIASPERCPTRSRSVVPRPSDRQRGRAVEEECHGAAKMVNNSASNSPLRHSSRASSSATSSKRGGHDRIRGGTSSSKKRRMDSRPYVKLFKPPYPSANPTDVVVATPDRAAKENTSTGHVADSNVAMLCEGGILIEKNNRLTNNAFCKVSGSQISVLHEASEARVDQ